MSRRVQKIGIALAATLLLAVVTWFATRKGVSADSAVPLREVADMTGQRVRVPATPRRILSFCTTATDTIMGLGVSDSLAAIDEYGVVIPGCQKIPVVAKGSALSRESVTAMKIDLAFIWWYQDDAAALLQDLSIPVVRIRSGRASELPATIRLIGQCVNAEDAAGSLAAKVEAFLHSVPASRSARAPRVFLELNGPFKTMGSDTYTNDLLELAGLVNIAAEAKGAVLFSAERLTQADPDAILVVGSPGDFEAIKQRPGFTDLRAVQRGQVFFLDRYWLVAGPNLPQSVSHIRAAIALPVLSSAVKE